MFKRLKEKALVVTNECFFFKFNKFFWCLSHSKRYIAKVILVCLIVTFLQEHTAEEYPIRHALSSDKRA